MFIYNDLINSNISEDSYFQHKVLPKYFPQIMQKNFSEEISQHQLRKEIVAMMAANKIVNELSGPLFIALMKDNDANIASITRVFFIVNEIFDIDQSWQKIQNFTDDKVIQIKAFTAIIKLIRRSMSWVLKNYSSQELQIEKVAQKYKEHSWNIISNLELLLPASLLKISSQIKDEYIAKGFDSNLANKISKIEHAVSVLDILNAADILATDQFKIAKIYFKIGGKLRFDILRSKCDEIIKSTTYLSRLSAQTIKADLYNKQQIITRKIAQIGLKNDTKFINWYRGHKHKINSIIEFINSLIFLENLDINMLVLINYRLQNFIEKIQD
jgi:glutamate dehydrogenase